MSCNLFSTDQSNIQPRPNSPIHLPTLAALTAAPEDLEAEALEPAPPDNVLVALGDVAVEFPLETSGAVDA